MKKKNEKALTALTCVIVLMAFVAIISTTIFVYVEQLREDQNEYISNYDLRNFIGEKIYCTLTPIKQIENNYLSFKDDYIYECKEDVIVVVNNTLELNNTYVILVTVFVYENNDIILIADTVNQ